MIQTGLIERAHDDLITDAAHDFYGLRLATCGLDQRIKIWQLDDENGTWNLDDEWKAHDAPISKVSWAHPEFGSILASASFDRTVKIWEQRLGNSSSSTSIQGTANVNGGNPSSQSTVASTTGSATVTAGAGIGNVVSTGATPASTAPATDISSRWVEMALLTEARGTVRAVEFAPHHFGLKLATISTDNFLRIYDSLDLKTFLSAEEIDVHSLPSLRHSRAINLSQATPTPTHAQASTAALEGASASLVAQALQQQAVGPAAPAGAPGRPGAGNREADGGWCLSWCKDRYWGEVIAVGCGIIGTVKIVQLSASRRPTVLLTLDHSPTTLDGPTLLGDASQATLESNAQAITCVSWAPSCGRSYHLIATGGRDGHVRIWRVKPADEGAVDGDTGIGSGGTESMGDAVGGGDLMGDIGADGEGEEEGDGRSKWTASVVADFDDHKSAVGRVEWNITGTVLSSAGNDGRIRLWKATVGNIWRPAGSIGVEQAKGEDNTKQRGAGDADVDMGEGVGNE